METEYEFTVTESDSGLCVASGFASTLEEANKDGLHYLMQYLQDGPHVYHVYEVTRKLIYRSS